jgi:hypothetical protein
MEKKMTTGKSMKIKKWFQDRDILCRVLKSSEWTPKTTFIITIEDDGICWDIEMRLAEEYGTLSLCHRIPMKVAGSRREAVAEIVQRMNRDFDFQCSRDRSIRFGACVGNFNINLKNGEITWQMSNFFGWNEFTDKDLDDFFGPWSNWFGGKMQELVAFAFGITEPSVLFEEMAEEAEFN